MPLELGIEFESLEIGAIQKRIGDIQKEIEQSFRETLTWTIDMDTDVREISEAYDKLEKLYIPCGEVVSTANSRRRTSEIHFPPPRPTLRLTTPSRLPSKEGIWKLNLTPEVPALPFSYNISSSDPNLLQPEEISPTSRRFDHVRSLSQWIPFSNSVPFSHNVTFSHNL